MIPYLLFLDFVHQVVSSSKPREEVGTYWGYKVRYASNISSVFKECPFKVSKFECSVCECIYMFLSASHDFFLYIYMFLRAIHEFLS